MDGERIIKLSSQGSSCVRFLKPLKEDDIVIGSHPPVPHHITLRYWELLLKLGKKVFIHKPVTNVLYPKCSGFFVVFVVFVVNSTRI